uniref:Uncharacterized protein n=1 Tax=Cyprinus carpio TaxID=7962 RepID=A0A8C1SPU3_CYPCA
QYTDDSVSCLLLLQVCDENDVRRARFIDRQKEVSLNYFNTASAGQRPSWNRFGHPWHKDKGTKVGTCGYCGVQFMQKHHH